MQGTFAIREFWIVSALVWKEVKDHIEFLRQNRVAFKSFTPTENVGKKFFVDRNSRRFWIDGGYSAPQPPSKHPQVAFNGDMNARREPWCRGGADGAGASAPPNRLLSCTRITPVPQVPQVS